MTNMVAEDEILTKISYPSPGQPRNISRAPRTRVLGHYLTIHYRTLSEMVLSKQYIILQ